MRIYLCVLMLCAICFAGKAQGISFRHLTVDHGLSNNSVTSIYQDKEGIIWLGTNNGLNLYDGNRVRTYYQQIDNPNSLSGNVANQIVGDADSDTVYVRTQNGVSAVHIATETFTTLSTYRFSFLFFNKNCTQLGVMNFWNTTDSGFTLSTGLSIKQASAVFMWTMIPF